MTMVSLTFILFLIIVFIVIFALLPTTSPYNRTRKPSGHGSKERSAWNLEARLENR